MLAYLKKYTLFYHSLWAAVLFCVAIFFAYKNYFIQDDAYIAFVYSKNFSNGHGFVWYPGSDEYGYTSFLYTFVVGCFMWFGLDPEWISATINYIAYIAALGLTYLLILTLSKSRLASACTVLALATHHTFSAYASSGLETMVVTALVLAFYTLLCTAYIQNRPLMAKWLAIFASAALLTRLDSALLLFPGYAWIAIEFGLFRNPRECIKDVQLWIVAGIPMLAVGSLLTWAHFYYGYALPNTFYAKIPGNQGLIWMGTRYINKYLSMHNYIPAYLVCVSLLAIAYFAFFKKRWREFIPTYCLISIIFIWLCYVIYIGGDFMEFRILTPILPLLLVAIFHPIMITLKNAQPTTKGSLAVIALAFLLYGNYYHGERVKSRRIMIDSMTESTYGLYHWVNSKNVNWRTVGQSLGNLFYTGHSDDVKISTSAAGTISYFSGLPSVDVHGLNSRDVLNNSIVFDVNPHRHRGPPVLFVGHTRIATTDFLTSQSVNLNIYHPQVMCPSGRNYTIMDRLVKQFPFKRHRTLLIPVNSRCYLVADYVTPHPQIDALINSGMIMDYQKQKNIFACPAWLCLN